MTLKYGRAGVRLTILVALISMASLRANAQTVTVPGNYPTIQAAINGVTSGTTIQVAAGTYNEALSINNVTRAITIRGVAGATIVNAAGRGAPAVQIINTSGAVVFQSMIFRNANFSMGGGFFIQSSSPSFFDCVFENNTATDGAGGAILSGANPAFVGSTIRNNVAQHFAGGVYIQASRPVFTNSDIVTNTSGAGAAPVGTNGAGGGVFSVDASPTFRGSRINGNRSKFASGGIHHQGVYGSAFGPSLLVVEDTEVADNVSVQFSAADNPSEGGGIHIEDNATATLTRARILRNIAATGGGLNTYRARFDIVDSVIDANQAKQTFSNFGFGGGIAATSNFAGQQGRPGAVVNLTRTLVRNNTAVGTNGAVTGIAGGFAILGDSIPGSTVKSSLSLNGSVVDSNRSGSQGGGMLLTQANLTITNSLVIRNSVIGGSSPAGGGVRVTNNSVVNISGSTFAHNTASGTTGNGIGGGIFINQDGNVAGSNAITINNSNFYANAVTGRGAGLFVGVTSTGAVNNNVFGDNTGLAGRGQITEDECTTVTYAGNDFAQEQATQIDSPGSCHVPRTSNSTSVDPRISHVLAVPGTGTTTTLAWTFARATDVTVAGVGTFSGPTGTVDLAPTASTTYSLTANASAGDGGAYPAETAGFTFVGPPPPPPPPAPLKTVDGDFDGDRKSDITVFRPSTGTWHIVSSRTGATSGVQWGNSADVVVPGDYDGDGKIDTAIFRPSNGTWFIINSRTGTTTGVQWGNSADLPVPGDYDGDGKTDVAIFRPSTGTWHIISSRTGTTSGVQWGNSADRVVPGDYDGDGKADVAVFRPSTGTWFIVNSRTGTTTGVQWGNSADVAVPGDYDGDGKTDVAVFRPSTGTWFIVSSRTGAVSGPQWGNSADRVVPADYDGDGKTDVAVFRPSDGTWYIVNSATGTTRGVQWGNANDIPINKR